MTKTFVHKDVKEYFILETADGRTVKITGNHPVSIGKKYIDVKNLKVGGIVHVLKENKLVDVAIKRITKKISSVDVYNIEADKTHNYFAEGILVHNKPIPSEPFPEPPLESGEVIIIP